MTEEQGIVLEEFIRNIEYSIETFIAKYGITDPDKVYEEIEIMCVNAQKG